MLSALLLTDYKTKVIGGGSALNAQIGPIIALLARG